MMKMLVLNDDDDEVEDKVDDGCLFRYMLCLQLRADILYGK